MKYIFFDFDGTIADTKGEILKIYNRLARFHHFKMINDDFFRSMSMRNIKEVLKELNISFFQLISVLYYVKRKIKKKIRFIPVFNEIKGVLEKFKNQDYYLGIISSNARKNVVQFLDYNHLHYFSIVRSAGLFTKNKMIKKMVRLLKIDKKDFFYVGDEVRDIHACKKAGVSVIAVSWGYNMKEKLEEAGPDYLIETPLQLLDIFIESENIKNE